MDRWHRLVRMEHLLIVAFLVALFAAPFATRVSAADEAKSDLQSSVARMEKHRNALEEEKELLRLFADTLEQVRSNYVDSEITDRELIEAAIRGMVSKLDPYSNYIPPSQVEQFRRSVDQEFGGIGIQVAIRNGQLQIISPLVGTPADRAGLRSGDRILKIGEASTKGLSLDDAVKLMKGELGSDVVITVLHPNEHEAETVTLKREQIHIPTVLGMRRKDDNQWDFFCDADQKIAYVRLTAFGRDSAKNLGRVLKQLVAQGAKALVLDLRFNPGGLLAEAIQVSDLFISEGEIVSIEGRNTPRKTWHAQADGTLLADGFPVAVIVNHFSASASEVVSACLKDHQVATIVGERTWGKGSVQNVIDLEGGKSVLKLTTASYQRPSGKNIHRLPNASQEDPWGVKPSDGYRVRLDIRETGQLDAHLRRQNALPIDETAGGDAADDGGDDATPEFVDRQLQKALECLRKQLLPEPAAAESNEESPPDSHDQDQESNPL